jgi:autotransporter-associated beta strand protein
LLTINAATHLSFEGGISGSGGLTKNGLGSLYLQGEANNTYTGTTTVNAGSITLYGLTGNNMIPGALDIGDGVGTDIDLVLFRESDRIADSATVSVFSTGQWDLFFNVGSGVGNSETITNLNIVSTGIAGGGLVWANGNLTVLGTTTMTGGSRH